MSWLENDVDLGHAAAAAIARGMRLVAQADGMIHVRELALIATFESSIPEGVEPLRDLPPEVVDVYVRSLLMVALADGRISPREEEVIAELAAEHGVEADALEAATGEVKRTFLAHFRGRSAFRTAVVQVAMDLGLPQREVDALRGEI